MSCKSTQGRALIAHMKRKPMTYMEMLTLGISTSPWKRIAETLLPSEKLVKATNVRGLTTWRVLGPKWPFGKA